MFLVLRYKLKNIQFIQYPAATIEKACLKLKHPYSVYIQRRAKCKLQVWIISPGWRIKSLNNVRKEHVQPIFSLWFRIFPLWKVAEKHNAIICMAEKNNIKLVRFLDHCWDYILMCVLFLILFIFDMWLNIFHIICDVFVTMLIRFILRKKKNQEGGSIY